MGLKAYREQKLQISKENLAAQLGIPTATLEAWEDDPDSMTGHDWKKVCSRLEVPREVIEYYQEKMALPSGLAIKDGWTTMTQLRVKSLEQLAAARKVMKTGDFGTRLDNLEVLVRQASRKPRMAFVGHSDVGKSTMINALLGQNILPREWGPETAIATFVKHVKDRPAFIREPVWIFKAEADANGEMFWDDSRLWDEAYCTQRCLYRGDYDVLKFATRRVGTVELNARPGAAVVFVDAPLLTGCDLIDLPGFGTERQRDTEIVKAMSGRMDLLVYLSQANGFLRETDIEYLKAMLGTLPAYKGQGNSPFGNLLVVASQARSIDHGSPEELKRLLDERCGDFIGTFPNLQSFERWAEAAACQFQTLGDVECALRKRFFTYAVESERGDLRKDFEQALGQSINVLDAAFLEDFKTTVAAQVKQMGEIAQKEVERNERARESYDEAYKEWKEIEEKEAARAQKALTAKARAQKHADEACKASVKAVYDRLAQRCSAEHIKNLLKEWDIERKQMKQFTSRYMTYLQQEVENSYSDIVKRYADEEGAVLRELRKDYVDISAEFGVICAEIPKDSSWIYRLGLLWSGLVGAGTLFSIFGGVASGVAGGVGGIMGAVSIGAVFAGPLLAVGLVLLGISVFNALTWRSRHAKQIAKKLEEERFSDKCVDKVREHWETLKKGITRGHELVEEEWQRHREAVRKSAEVPVNEAELNALQALHKCFKDWLGVFADK